MKKTIIVLLALSLLISCGGTQYRDHNKASGSGEWGPYEIRKTTKFMVSSLYTFLKSEKKSALIQIKRIKNRTSEHIETQMLSDELLTNLLKKRIQFVDSKYDKDAIKEMGKGMSGLVDEEYAIPVGKLRSPNMYLYGEITENVRYVRGKEVQYLVVTFTLKSLKTGMMLWKESKKFLKATSTDKLEI